LRFACARTVGATALVMISPILGAACTAHHSRRVATGTTRASDRLSAPVAVVAGTPIPRSFFKKGMAVKAAAYRHEFGASSLDRTASRRLRDDTLMSLVRDIAVVLEARRLHLAPPKGSALTVATQNPTLMSELYRRLYAFAAHSVPPPRNPGVRAALARGFDPEMAGRVLTPSQVAIYNRWLAARDRAASEWFKTLFLSYARRTHYAAGFAPYDLGGATGPIPRRR
jgi:hypothetical protein